MTIERILVGIDGSPDSRAALHWAVERAVDVDAEVIALHALGLLDHLASDGGRAPTATQGADITEVFESEWCAQLDQGGVRNRRLVEDGPPAMVILRMSERLEVDLVVVGQRGVGASSSSCSAAPACRWSTAHGCR